MHVTSVPVASHCAELLRQRGVTTTNGAGVHHECSLGPVRQPGRSQVPEVPRRSGQGGPGLDATGRDAGTLELTEQGTRIADAAGGVTDEAWANAAKHYDEDQLTTLVSVIALINTFNRVNVIVQRPAGDHQPGQFG